MFVGHQHGAIQSYWPRPTACWSTRRINKAYTGPAIRVRRSLDNTEQDINFLANHTLDTTTLLSFVGGGNDGFVTTWYDQQFHQYHATQVTAAAQPKIVNAGSLIVDPKVSKPTILFNGTTTYFDVSTSTIIGNLYNDIRGDFCVLAVSSCTAVGAGSWAIYGEFSTVGGGYQLMWTVKTASRRARAWAIGTDSLGSNPSDINSHLINQNYLYVQNKRNTIHHFYNKLTDVSGSPQTKTLASPISVTSVSIGASAGTYFHGGNISEICVYKWALTAQQRTAISNEIISYYNVTVP